MKVIDLFCCEGGAAMGWHLAGWEVHGIDIVPQPLYPFPMMVADVTGYDGYEDWWQEYDAIWASPPCQSYSTMSNRFGSDELELIPLVRDICRATGLPYVIENVTGARSHLIDPLMIHGGQLGLDVYRPRLFESNVLLMSPPPAARPDDPVAVYGVKEDRRVLWTRRDGTKLRAASLQQARDAMEMPWASWNGCREAVPPRYAKWIAEQIAQHVKGAAA